MEHTHTLERVHGTDRKCGNSKILINTIHKSLKMVPMLLSHFLCEAPLKIYNTIRRTTKISVLMNNCMIDLSQRLASVCGPTSKAESTRYPPSVQNENLTSERAWSNDDVEYRYSIHGRERGAGIVGETSFTWHGGGRVASRGKSGAEVIHSGLIS